MPLLSAFTPCGILALSSAPSEAENIYNALINNLGGNYSVAQGSREDAWCYSLAMALARVRLTLIHAGLQISPLCVTEMMDDREDEWQIVPGPFDSLEVRRAVLAAREKLSRGARRESVEDALTTLLGDIFAWYYTTKRPDITTWPLDLGDQPQNLQLPSIPRKRLTITQPITVGLGSPQAVTYDFRNMSGDDVLVGDTFTVDPDNFDRAEVVTVTAVSSTTFTATFNNPHDDNVIATTMPFPMWVSNQRADLVVTTPAAAIDPEARRKVDDLMGRILRGVSTWAIVGESAPGIAGPFIIGTSPIGATPFGVVTYP